MIDPKLKIKVLTPSPTNVVVHRKDVKHTKEEPSKESVDEKENVLSIDPKTEYLKTCNAQEDASLVEEGDKEAKSTMEKDTIGEISLSLARDLKISVTEKSDDLISRGPVRGSELFFNDIPRNPYQRYEPKNFVYTVTERTLSSSSEFTNLLGNQFCSNKFDDDSSSSNVSDCNVLQMIEQLLSEFGNNPTAVEKQLTEMVETSSSSDDSSVYSPGSTASYSPDPPSCSGSDQMGPLYPQSDGEPCLYTLECVTSYDSSRSPQEDYFSASVGFKDTPKNNDLVRSSLEEQPGIRGSVKIYYKNEIEKLLDPQEREEAWTRIMKVNEKKLLDVDNDGDTQLMILLSSSLKKERLMVYLYVLIERLLNTHPKYLSQKNKCHGDALFLAAMNFEDPLIPGYVAEALARTNQNLNVKYQSGNTILHKLAEKGDAASRVLETLCKLQTDQGTYLLDLQLRNTEGYTPLHTAVAHHKQNSKSCYKIIKILLQHNINLYAQAFIKIDTALHIAIQKSCDPKIIKLLLDADCIAERKLVGVINRDSNTAVHLACERNDLDLDTQKEVVEMLMDYGGDIHIKNNKGNVPSALISAARKSEIKSILRRTRSTKY